MVFNTLLVSIFSMIEILQNPVSVEIFLQHDHAPGKMQRNGFPS